MTLTLETAQQKLGVLGFTDVDYAASGMEGHVFRIGDESVAKVWFSKSSKDMAPLKQFYERLQTLNPPFATPLITQVKEVDGTTISVETELTGTAMRRLVNENEREVPAFALNAILT